MEIQGPVLHILVVGFHHQRGSQVEFVYPPLGDSRVDCNSPCELPPSWKCLPFVALPDGAHNYSQDSVFFHLSGDQDDDDSGRTIYGVSCYRQIDTKDLLNKDDQLTRHTVQKSVCVLCNLPYYGYIKAKLEIVTHAYFEQRDFTKTEILETFYKGLNSSLNTSLPKESEMIIELNVRDLVLKFRHRILALFKVLLLERKVMFYGFPVSCLCTSLLSLVSLIPGMITYGLSHSTCVEEGSTMNNPNNNSEDEQDPVFPSSTFDNPLVTDAFGLPLAVFTKNSLFHPYLSLHQMEVLKNPKVRSFVVGTTNMLLRRQQSEIVDVFVDLDQGSIEFNDSVLSSELNLSTADLRFTDTLIRHTLNYNTGDTQDTGWEGSEEWIRAQFRTYLLSLFSTVQHTDGQNMTDFNHLFVASWRSTHNFSVWHTQTNPGIDDIHAGHPCQGQIGISDLKIRLSNTMQDVTQKSMETEQGRRLGQAVVQTSQVVGGVLSSAKSLVSSWFTEPTEDEEPIRDEVFEAKEHEKDS